MIELIVKEHLEQNILNVPVVFEQPETKPNQFILIDKTGSGRENYINEATLAIQSYGKTLNDALLLNEQVKSVMFDLIQNNKVSRCALDTDYNFTDETTKSYRYQAVFDITYFD